MLLNFSNQLFFGAHLAPQPISLGLHHGKFFLNLEEHLVELLFLISQLLDKVSLLLKLQRCVVVVPLQIDEVCVGLNVRLLLFLIPIDP